MLSSNHLLAVRFVFSRHKEIYARVFSRIVSGIKEDETGFSAGVLTDAELENGPTGTMASDNMDSDVYLSGKTKTSILLGSS